MRSLNQLSQLAVLTCGYLLLNFPSLSESRRVSFNYIGCFKDYVNSVRDIDGLILTTITQFGSYPSSVAMTWEYCSTVCSWGGFPYMGLQNKAGCYCGYSYGSQGASPACSTTCDGNAAQICGASSVNSVFSLTYPDNTHFLLSPRAYVIPKNLYTLPLYSTVLATDALACSTYCRAGCQAILFNKPQKSCYLLKFGLIPFNLSSVDGDFYTRA